MQQVVDTLLSTSTDVPASEVARRAGINRSTLHRIATGEVDPSLGTLRELAIAQGLDLELVLRPLSDPDAATAARALLDDRLPSELVTESVAQWVERLRRSTKQELDPIQVVAIAGRSSSLLYRQGAVLLRGDDAELRLASAGDSTGQQWAVSGRAALSRGRGSGAVGPSVLWVDDVKRAASLLADTHRVVSSPLNAQVILAPSSPSVYVDSSYDGLVRYVAPIQMVLDCIGLGGDLESEALSIATEWSE